MSTEGQTYGGEGSPLCEHFRYLGRQVGGGRHQDLAQVTSPCSGLLRWPINTNTMWEACLSLRIMKKTVTGQDTLTLRKLLKSKISWQRQRGTYTYFSFCVSNLKMWTVSVLLEADRYKPSILNASEQMLTHLRKHTESGQSIDSLKI